MDLMESIQNTFITFFKFKLLQTIYNSLYDEYGLFEISLIIFIATVTICMFESSIYKILEILS